MSVDTYKGRVLIVEDDRSVRTSLSMVLASVGYEVFGAFDGFSALAEMRKGLPDVLMSDLNMPGMSGYEFLYVVRQRFPRIPVIAMSGGFADLQAPAGLAMDRFHRKGGSLVDLLKMLKILIDSEEPLEQRSEACTPIWVSMTLRDESGVESVALCCPGCLRTYLEPVGAKNAVIHEAPCVFCGTYVCYAVVQQAYAGSFSQRLDPLR